MTEALYFDSGGRQLFGWLHRPAEQTAAGVGLVICKPFGYEAICAQRSIRAFAEAAARIGVSALRFDYAGTGDSADIEPQEDQIAVWSSDVSAAVNELSRLTGVDHVCILGIRLGALLATLAAANRNEACSLILISPIISGPRYLRELRTTRLAALLGVRDGDLGDGTAMSGELEPDGSMEVSGFLLSRATLAALAEIDLKALSAAPASEILILDSTSLPVARAWPSMLSGLGVSTKYLALPGLIEMVMTAPQFAAVPNAMIGKICDWLDHLKGGSLASLSVARGTRPITARSQGKAVLVLHGDDSGSARSISERPVSLASTTLLFGIVTEPVEQERRRRSVVLLSVGADYHIGPNRMYVDLARGWARHGYVVLRMDLAGIGDSGTRPGCSDDEVFPPAALDDIRIAIGFLRDRYGVTRISLVGVCSGAYHALRAAVAGLPVDRILMINPANYFWKRGMNLADVQLAEAVRNPGVHRERLLSLFGWRRLLTGQVNLWRTLLIYCKRLSLAAESTLRDCARTLGIRLPNDLGFELEQISARGVRVVFLFAKDEPGIDLLALQAGSSVSRLGDRCRVHIIGGGDHIFSKSAVRSLMKNLLSNELFEHSEYGGAHQLNHDHHHA
ncbi:MAG TPA: alpha/beta fold hydrolase [Xanthobacteraceae bacterium]|nr:alpha/beta fold hydrolase [Xanthobacteraceae bacterium]